MDASGAETSIFGVEVDVGCVWMRVLLWGCGYDNCGGRGSGVFVGSEKGGVGHQFECTSPLFVEGRVVGIAAKEGLNDGMVVGVIGGAVSYCASCDDDDRLWVAQIDSQT